MPNSQHVLSTNFLREQVQSGLDAKRILQAELDSHLSEARDDLGIWLGMMIAEIEREKANLKRSGDIADGNLQANWNLLRESVDRLRSAQETVKSNELEIAGLLADLADDELWKGVA